jgi:hypothetical protein
LADNAGNTLVIDSSSAGNNGFAYANTSSLTTAGQIDGALSLVRSSGSGVYTGSNINDSGSYTVEGWINQVTTNAYSAWMGVNVGGANTIFIGTNGTNYYILGGGTGGSTSTAIPATGVWFHVVVTYNSGTGTLTLYQNGSSVYTASGGTGNTTAFYFAVLSGNHALTSAKMDEVRFSTLFVPPIGFLLNITTKTHPEI